MTDTVWPKFLTVEEIADVMRVSKMTVYRLIHEGELEGKRIGRCFRVTEDSFTEYLKRAYEVPDTTETV